MCAPWATKRRMVGIQPEMTAATRGVGAPQLGSAPRERRSSMAEVFVGGVCWSWAARALAEGPVVLGVLPILAADVCVGVGV